MNELDTSTLVACLLAQGAGENTDKVFNIASQLTALSEVDLKRLLLAALLSN
jgi:hypothetical protein